MITIFDYGAGNLQSVKNALGAIGVECEQVSDANALRHASKIILPGVGHFKQMMRSLDRLDVRETLVERMRAGVPFLGICLGLQALFTSSEEAPAEKGLGVFQGSVRRFLGEDRIPHMGWNEILPQGDSRLLKDTGAKPFFYFAHSFYCPVMNKTVAVCDYISRFTAVLEQGNVCGVQFHPEKSGALGLQVLRNFAEARF